jgi:hypothetical protein
MQVTDKNIVYPFPGDMVLAQLELGTFTTVDQTEALICIEQMSA